MNIYNALQTRSGAKTEYNKLGTLAQPTQFLPQKEKDETWTAWNLDWLEYQGIRQLRRNGKRFLKNIKLANGIIDRTDYIIDEDNDMSDVIANLTKEDMTAYDLKFFPIIPNVINVLTGEFSKRVSKLMFRAVDDLSYNEMLEEKRQAMEDSLVKMEEQKLILKMIEQGMDPQDPQAQQILSMDNIKTLPEVQDFFNKSYRNVVEEWATHVKNVDEERFYMQELEQEQFKTMLTLDREFWHFKMNEDDYEVERWDPLFTFYHKSPNARYISQGNWVGKVDLLTIADVIDKYGYLMTDEQLKSLERIFPIKSLAYNIEGTPNDGSFYDGTKSYKWNTGTPSLGYRQMAAMHDNWNFSGDIFSQLMSDNEDYLEFGNTNLIRVSTIYWKTQRKLYHLTKIIEGEPKPVEDIVDESYVVTEKPIYDTTIYNLKTKNNLVAGEHLDAIWINETWGGVKIGANRPTSWMNEPMEINPMYLGINTPKPGRLPFQFKGDLTLYGCKLPVEGCVFTDRNIRSTSLVDLMKSYQIIHNLCLNQASDILVDELGTIIVLDHNMIPKNSMGEDWGKNNMAKAFIAMKNFQILPVDTTLQNTETNVNFQQFTHLDMEQSKRLLTRIDIAKWAKESAFEVVGITPQRLGNVTASESATGTQQAVNNSYAQTEKYFTQHCDYLMPRVHQMRTDLAQYYCSMRPSLRLQYITSLDEKINFSLNGTDLLARDFNIFPTTKVNSREIMNQMKQLAMTNNTTGYSLLDLGNVMKADSIAEMTRVLKEAEAKQMQKAQAEQQQQMTIEQQRLEQEQAQFKDAQDRQDARDKNKNETQILVAEIRAAAVPKPEGNDEYLTRLAHIEGQDQFQETMDVKREQENNKVAINAENNQLKREDMQTKRDIAQRQENIARINKNKYDKPKPKK